MKQVVLITGSSTGIGRATALYFAAQGWQVVATMREPGATTGLENQDGIEKVRLDVMDEPSIREAVAGAVKRHGRIDVLVNNAGYALAGPFETAADGQVKRQFETNLFGLMRMTKEVIPVMRGQGEGAIVCISSVGGRMVFPGMLLYNSTKWAVEGFAEGLAFELKPQGIRVKLVEPGAIKTDFYDRSLEISPDNGIGAYQRLNAIIKERMLTRTNFYSKPRSVARVIYKAAVSKNGRLRYPAAGGASLILALRWLLPDRLFRGLMWAAMK